jgi:hypothetical protein
MKPRSNPTSTEVAEATYAEVSTKSEGDRVRNSLFLSSLGLFATPSAQYFLFNPPTLPGEGMKDVTGATPVPANPAGRMV